MPTPPSALIAVSAFRAHRTGLLVRAAVILAFVLFWQFGQPFVEWAFKYPKDAIIPIAKWISQFTKWLTNEATFGLFTFAELTRFIAAVIEVPYTAVLSLMSTGLMSGPGSSAVQYLPPLSWIAVITIVSLLGFHAGGRQLALIVAICFGFVAIFGQ